MTEPSTQCPSCTRTGAPVGRTTLEALLAPGGLRRGVPAQPRYWATAECPIVYFDAGGDVRARELRESVAREVQARRCACEVKNPAGGCCLGDLVRLERGGASEAPAPSCAVS